MMTNMLLRYFPKHHVRNWKIYKQDVLDHGPIEGCPGCRAVIRGSIAKAGHSHQCRLRMLDLLNESAHGKARIERSSARKEEEDGGPPTPPEDMNPNLMDRWNQLPSGMSAYDRKAWIRSQELLRQGHPGTIGPKTNRGGTLPPPIHPGATVPSPTPAGAAANRERLMREHRGAKR